MKKIKTLLIMLIALTMVIEACNALTLETYQFCRNIDVTDWENFSKPVSCVEETSEFLDTDTAAYVLVKLTSLTTGDKFDYEITSPSGASLVDEPPLTLEEDLDIWYDFRKVVIAENNLEPGDYIVKLFVNDEEIISDSFEIIRDMSDICEALGYYCCPSNKVCLSAQEGACEGGVCCDSEEVCKVFSPHYFTRTEITNCEEEGLNDCGRVVKLYDYSIHARIDPEQTAVIYFRGVDVDCGDIRDVAIAYYDEETGTWIEKVTNIEETEAEDSYKATAILDYLGYVALIRTDECVPKLCTYGGYRTTPVGAYVNFGETITFELCGLVSGCEAVEDGTCDRHCTDGVDPDCPECTAAQGDCCLISYDNACDLDCASGVDPDCCEKPKELCCPGDATLSGSTGCDKNCGLSDESCTECTNAGGDCCKATSNGVCDPDCPKLSNGVGYLDVDCCAPNAISITSARGDCCNAGCNGVCDPDCLAGTDPDCHGKGCCGDGTCQSSEDYYSCPSDCCYYDGTYCYGDCCYGYS